MSGAAKTHVLRAKPPWRQDGNRTRCGRRAESRMAAIWPDAEMAATARPYRQWSAIIRGGSRHLAPAHIRNPSGARLPPDDLAPFWALMAADQVHIYQVLTKRRNWARRLASSLPWPPNVWLGASAETSRYEHRADQLRAVPTATATGR